MQLFKDHRGFVYAFGFNIGGREPHATMVSWIEPGKPADETSWQEFDFDIDPQFVTESRDGAVIAYQPGRCIEIRPTGDRTVLSFRIIKAA